MASAADCVGAAVQAIVAGRPGGQTAALAAQLRELSQVLAEGRLGLRADAPLAIGICGGRLRIAFMHPDMGRFFGPAWQTPIGAGDAEGREQIVVAVQASDDHRIWLYPTNPAFCEQRDWVAADLDCMYPGPQVDDWYGYERYGTQMAEAVLASLGYVTDAQLGAMRSDGRETPSTHRWVSANMRRPFSLVCNAVVSMRTLHHGAEGERVQAALGRGRFRGMRLATCGAIPQGGFASSSAVTLATQNALSAFYGLQLSPDTLVHLACQAEYGTGVRAGSLDQATEQKGRAGQGALISSNPKDHYRVCGTFPVPTDRIRLLFPYSVDRDREAWQWSAGNYAPRSASGRITAGEVRKMTGKSAELAAILLRLPVATDFFREIEEDLIEDGALSLPNRLKVYDYLRRLPLLISREELHARVYANRQWFAQQIVEHEGIPLNAALQKTETTFAALFAEWPEPVLRRSTPDGEVVTERGVPLRAMLAYLFGEVAKNLTLVNRPQEWIEWVSRSQLGDRCFDIDPARLPSREEVLQTLDWERGLVGPQRLEAWLARFGARPFDHNRGLDDASLERAIADIRCAMETRGSDPVSTQLRFLEGGNFFRGLALLDLVEAMLKRAFGADAVALRVNAAGQGDFFQVHVDTHKAGTCEVMEFIRLAVYHRFGLKPPYEFVETHPGGGAVGIRLERMDQLADLIDRLERCASGVSHRSQ